MKAYELLHIVGFEETNLVGNVYYANYVRWQGRCREMFLRDHAPEILNELQNGLYLVTVRVSCEYFNELFALDQLAIRMRIGDITQNRVTMLFDYYRLDEQGETFIARGEQQIACMGKQDKQLYPVPIPEVLETALALYQE
ncbi:MAG: enediyne core biosynthesis thioesterase [Methyloprofundus sp.]|nr:MAG: enediyne core biosynthesis thioesterase [Methyloprofundus sp.]